MSPGRNRSPSAQILKFDEFDYHRPDRLYSLIDYSNHLSVFSRVLPTNTCILIFLYKKKKTERVCLRYMWGSLFIARRLCHQAGTTHRSLHFILKEKKMKVNCCRVSTLSRIHKSGRNMANPYSKPLSWLTSRTGTEHSQLAVIMSWLDGPMHDFLLN